MSADGDKLLESQDQWLDVVRSGDLKAIGKMLKTIDIDKTAGSLGPTGLHVAASNGLVQVVGLLINKGAEINKRNLGRNGATALHLAVHSEDLDTVELLIEEKADPLMPTHSGQTVLDLIDEKDSELYKVVSKYYSACQVERDRKRLAKDFDERKLFADDDEPQYCTFDVVAEVVAKQAKARRAAESNGGLTPAPQVAPVAQPVVAVADDNDDDDLSSTSSVSSDDEKKASASKSKQRHRKRKSSKRSDDRSARNNSSSSARKSEDKRAAEAVKATPPAPAPAPARIVAATVVAKDDRDRKPVSSSSGSSSASASAVRQASSTISSAAEIAYDDLVFDAAAAAANKTVHNATWRSTPVAIKLPHVPRVCDDAYRAVLQSELALHSRLRHPNIVTVFGGCFERGKPFAVVSELLVGGSLYDALHVQHRPLSAVERLFVAREVAIALAYCDASSPKIVHGDLKSANVLFGQTMSTVKVGDFGAAKLQHAATAPMSAPAASERWRYVAPEVLAGDDDDHADVYSFGILLWELFSGLVPYHDRVSDAALGAEVRSSQLRPTPRVSPAATPDLVAIYEACWAHAPHDRPAFADVAKQLTALHTAAQSRAAAQAPVGSSNDDTQCTVCMDKKRDCVFADCGHVAVCMTCVDALDKCPICMQAKGKIIKLYNV